MTAPLTADATRLRYARAIRAMRSLEAGAQLLEAFDVDVLRHVYADRDTRELRELEQLPDWRRSTLLAHVMAPPAPSALHAADLLICRSMVLIGKLAIACEQAAKLGDAKTARAMAKLAHGELLMIKGDAALGVAFGFEADVPDA